MSITTTTTTKKKTYTFITDIGEKNTFDDPDDGVGWYTHETDPTSVLVEIVIGEVEV
jgi:hypothetical protein